MNRVCWDYYPRTEAYVTPTQQAQAVQRDKQPQAEATAVLRTARTRRAAIAPSRG